MKTIPHQKSKGFTLIELMIVIAIIGILAAVALPQYQNYTVRAKLSEAILAASSCRTSISEVYVSESDGPSANNWGCEANFDTCAATSKVSEYVLCITTDANGVVTVKVDNATLNTDDITASANAITLIPFHDKDNPKTAADNMGTSVFKWECGPAETNGIPSKYLPGSCRYQKTEG